MFLAEVGFEADSIRGKITTPERAYEDVIDFIAGGTTPGHIIAFRPSAEYKQRLAELIQPKKDSGLSRDDDSELERYLQLEHLMRLAKARAQQYLAA